MFIIGKIISDGETNKKLVLKIRAKCKSANMGSSTVQLNGVDLIDIQVQS